MGEKFKGQLPMDMRPDEEVFTIDDSDEENPKLIRIPSKAEQEESVKRGIDAMEAAKAKFAREHLNKNSHKQE